MKATAPAGWGARQLVRAFLATALLLITPGAPALAAEQGPSFNCAKAGSVIERAICADDQLSALDRLLAKTYSDARDVAKAAGGQAADELLAEQRRWLRRRAQCGGDAGCLADSMRERVAELGAPVAQSMAASAGASCEQRLAHARRYSDALGVTVSLLERDENGFVPAEAEIAIRSEVAFGSPSLARPDLPLFLIVDAQPEARFSAAGLDGGEMVGPGFLTLTAGARGIMNVAHAADRARAVFPLHLDLLVSASEGMHRVAVNPGKPGPETTGWAVIAAGDCGEHVVAEGRSQTFIVPIMNVAAAITDAYGFTPPAVHVRDGSGMRELLVYDGRYEVRDVRTGTVVTRRQGEYPTFSPTGRFVAHIRPSDGNIVVIDLLADKEVKTLLPGQLVWIRDDSYVLHSGAMGAFSHFQPLVDSAPEQGKTFVVQCTACDHWHGDTTLDLDLGYMAIIGTDDRVEIVDLATERWLTVVPPRGLHEDQRPSDAMAPEPRLSTLREAAAVAARATYGQGAQISAGGWSVGEPLLVTHGGPEPQGALAAGIVFAGADAGATPHEPDAEADPLEGVQLGGRGLVMPDAAARGATPLVPRLPGDIAGSDALRRIEDAIGTLLPAMAVDGFDAQAGQDLEARLDRLRRDVPEAAERIGVNENGCKETAFGFRGPYFDGTVISAMWSWPMAGRNWHAIQTECTQGSLNVNYGQLWLLGGGTGAAGGVAIDLLDLFIGEDARDEDDHPLGFRSTPEQRVRIAPAGDDLLIVIAPPSGMGVIVDLRSGQRIGKPFAAGDAHLVAEMRLTDDRRHVVLLHADDRFRVVNVDSAMQGLDRRPPDLLGAHVDDEIVVMTPDGRFDATYEGAQAVQLRIAGEASLPTAHQFGARLRRPGLAETVMNLSTVADIDAFERAGRLDLNGPAGYVLPPPSVQLALSEASEGMRRATVDYASMSTGNIVRLYVDGRVVAELPAPVRSGTVSFAFDDPGGGRWISALAVDAKGVTSLPSSVHLPAPAAARGTMRAVLIGIDDYRSDPAIPPLRYAASDARRLAGALEAGEILSVTGVETTVLADADATRPAVLEAMRRTAEASGPDDTLVIFFAGHGLSDGRAGEADRRLLLALADTRLDKPASALGWSDLVDAVAAAQGTVVFVLDACHAGLAGSDAFATNDDAAGALLTQAGKPIVVLASSKGRQVSIETAQAGGGIFTAVLAEAIEGRRAQTDRDANGMIDLGELYGAVRAGVVERTGGRQTPWLARNAMIGEMALF